MVGTLFALGAYFRKGNWKERSAATAIAAVAFAAPLTNGSLLFAGGALVIFAAYDRLLARAAIEQSGWPR